MSNTNSIYKPNGVKKQAKKNYSAELSAEVEGLFRKLRTHFLTVGGADVKCFDDLKNYFHYEQGVFRRYNNFHSSPSQKGGAANE